MADVSDGSITPVNDFSGYSNTELTGFLSAMRSGTYCDNQWCRLSILNGYGTISSTDLAKLTKNATYADVAGTDIGAEWFISCNTSSGGSNWLSSECAGPRGEASDFGIYDFFSYTGRDVSLVLYESAGWEQPITSYSLSSFDNELQTRNLGGFRQPTITPPEKTTSSLTEAIQQSLNFFDAQMAVFSVVTLLFSLLVLIYGARRVLRFFGIQRG